MSDKLNKGIALMTQIVGADAAKRVDSVQGTLFEETVEWSIGEIWGSLFQRPNLSLRDRSLIMIASDVVLMRSDALRDHVRLGLAAGLSREELVETVFHLAFYGGFPTLVGANRVLVEMFAELDKANADQAKA